MSPKQDDHDLLTFLRSRIPSPQPTTGWGHFLSGLPLPSNSEEQAPRLLFLGLYLASLAAAALADVHKSGRYLGDVALKSFQLQSGEDPAGVVTVSLTDTASPAAGAGTISSDAAAIDESTSVSQQYDTVLLTGVIAALLVAATALNGAYARDFAGQAPEMAAAAMPQELAAIGISPATAKTLQRAAAPVAGRRSPGAGRVARALAMEAVRVLAVGPHRASEEELRAVRVLCERVRIRDLSDVAAGDAELSE